MKTLGQIGNTTNEMGYNIKKIGNSTVVTTKKIGQDWSEEKYSEITFWGTLQVFPTLKK